MDGTAPTDVRAGANKAVTRMYRLLYLAFFGAILLAAVSVPAAETIVTINASNTYQVIEGFGASLTDSSAYVLRYGMSAQARSNLLAHLFSPTNGIGLNVLRQPIGASDFRLTEYTYDDMPAGQTDYALANFSVAYDDAYIVPLLQQISILNTNLKIMASPWSPPAWMKDSGDLYDGSLLTNAYTTYAAYLRKYVQAYAARGLPIHYITLQNEPLYEPGTYAGSYMSAAEQIELVKRVGRDFETNDIATRILAYDHNWDQFNYPITVMNNAEAKAYLAGSAFHGYAGDVSVQTLVHDAHPDKDIFFTECSGLLSGSFSNSLLWDAQTLIVNGLRHWSKTVIKWNVALDQNGGPKLAGGCGTCRGLVTINTNTFVVTTNAEYYALGHASRFLQPGARRIDAVEALADGPFTVAFVNPDQSLVAIACNPNTSPRDFTFRWNAESFNYVLPARSVATFTWPNAAGATVDVWMTTGDRSKLLAKQTDSPVFRPVTLAWKGRTWNVRDSRGNPDDNRWSAAGATIDPDGNLRLRVQNLGGTWYCGMVEATQSLAHGTYRWQVVGRPDLIHSNVVAGLGTYFDANHELDIEITKAYADAPTNIFCTVQPYYLPGHQYARAHSFTGTLTTHEFRWTPRQVAYRSWYGNSTTPPAPSAVFAQWTYEGDDVPDDTNELARMSLWMFNGAPPTASQELVLADFAYEPATGTFVFDDFEDASLSNVWQRYNDDGTRVTESNGTLNVTPADSDNDSLGVNTVNPVSWADDGLSTIFSASLATASVSSARAAGGTDLWGYQAVVSGPAGSYNPYACSNAAILRTGYDASADELTVEFLTKSGTASSWGSSRYVATIAGASTFFSGGGIEFSFTLVYSNYSVAASYNGNPVSMTTVSGSSTGLHNLAVSAGPWRYVLGAQNRDDGRGTIHWAQAGVRSEAQLPSTAGGNGNGGPGTTVVQLGDGSASTTWRAPIDSTYTRHRTMVLYKADDIGRSGAITQLLVNTLSAPDVTLERYTIRMQHTALDQVGATFINSGWTTVHQANVSIPLDQHGWYPFNFSTSFVYDARSNLLVDFVFQNPSSDSYPVPAATYTPSAYQSCFAVSAGRNDPFTWTTAPGGKKFTFNGNRVVDVRLAFPNEPPTPIGENMSFEDGPPGFLTNVPAWTVEGSPYAGAIKVGPAHHGVQSLKLWKGEGSGDQRLCQFFPAAATSQYTLTGYILSESGEPFSGSNAYGALLLEWYGAAGKLGSDESEPFTEDSMLNVWLPFSLTCVPPAGTTSGRVVCALVSSPDQAGSLFFDRLDIQKASAPPPSGDTPSARVGYLADEFDDTTMSNCWQLTQNWNDASFWETNGLLHVRPGTDENQSSGYVSTQPVLWNNTSAWYVFSASLATISVDSVSGTNDIEILLGVCSMPDNPWWVTNSCGIYGYYDLSADTMIVQLLMKTDTPALGGSERFNATVTNVSAYLDGTNRIRISLALGQNQYQLRLSDHSGLPIPYTLNAGSPQGAHYLGDKLCTAYWLVGAQNDGTNRGVVSWDRTAVFRTTQPGAQVVSAAQTSGDGAGTVTVVGRVWDANGDPCRLRIEASTNRGASWSAISAASVHSTISAQLAPAQALVQLVSIQTTNSAGLTATNEVSVTWNTIAAGFANATVTDMVVRISADDGDVGPAASTGSYFLVDNEPPSPASAVVEVEDGAEWTLNSSLLATWSGFSDAGSAIARYYYALTNRGGTASAEWTTEPVALVGDAEPDATNTVHVWAADAYGNIGQAVSASIFVLDPAGDFDDDGYSNLEESILGTDPRDLFSFMLMEGSVAAGEEDYVIRWNSAVGREYSVYSADVVGDEWQPVSGCTNMAGTGGELTCTASLHSVSARYYQIGARKP